MKQACPRIQKKDLYEDCKETLYSEGSRYPDVARRKI